MTSAAPLPSLGQIAPKMWAEAVRWSFGALGRVPRLAHRRVTLFFWPTRASSANQISMAAGSTPFSCPTCARRSVNPLAEVDDPPSYDAMSGRNRAALDDRCQRGSVRIVQPRRLSRRLAIDQAVRPERVELEHPIVNDLKRHTANLRRLGASCAFVNRRQSQKPPCLRPILRSFRGGPDHLCVKIGPKRNGHGEPPLFATLNHLAADSKIPNRVTLSGIWY